MLVWPWGVAGLLCLIFTHTALAVPWGRLVGGYHRDERRKTRGSAPRSLSGLTGLCAVCQKPAVV